MLYKKMKFLALAEYVPLKFTTKMLSKRISVTQNVQYLWPKY